ncbi:target of rapamycin (TOR) kinase 1 [Trypanosoma cruzi]|nr:target of rapamycin (TOR) kinase 1 [Trypanosoma cruzi]
MPALNSSTIAEMEVVASRFLYAAAILCTRLFDYYFFIKAVRRRLSALHQGIVRETSPANLPPAAVGSGERLRHTSRTIVSESSIPRKGIGRHHHGLIAPWLGSRFYSRLRRR